MPGKSKKGGGLESSPVYKKQRYGEGVSPFTMRSGNSPLKKGILKSAWEGTKAFFGAKSQPFLAAKMRYKATRAEK